MVLLPLEFTDCLQDSPYFRDSLQSHEKELERTSQAIKELIKEVKSLLQAAKSKSILHPINLPFPFFFCTRRFPAAHLKMVAVTNSILG